MITVGISLVALVLLSGCGGSDTTGADLGSATGTTISDGRTAELLDMLLDNSSTASAALTEIVAAEDHRFTAVLIELLRARQFARIPGLVAEYGQALDDLTDQGFGSDWPRWVEWYGTTDLRPPPGFTGWKGRVLGRTDPEYAQLLRDDTPSAVRTEEVVWGGVPVDGIPALDNPNRVAADEADFLTPEEPVFGIALNGEARAYPLRIMDWHEMANDVIGGVPVSLAYCTLCGAGIALDARASDGKTYTFGSSGLLFRSNKLMYDRQTRTLWNQFTGEAVLGELVGSAVEFERVPVVLTSWQTWTERHPDTTVISLDTGFERPYVIGAAYGRYFTSDTTMFPVWQRRDDLPEKSWVYGLHVGGIPKAYPLETIVADRVVNDRIGDTAVVLVAAGDIVTAWPDPIDYQAGAEIRAYDRGEAAFALTSDPDVLKDETGASWHVTEDGLVGPSGQTAPRIAGHLSYWFGWYAFFPRTELHGDG